MPTAEGLPDHIVGIVLAAGSSSRLGRPKQLLPLAGMPVISHVVERALAAGLDTVIVVTGGAGDGVAAALAAYPVVIVPNSRYREGQSTSLVAGLATIQRSAFVDAVVVLLGDQPGVDQADIAALIDLRRTHPAPAIVMTSYDATRSHPILFGREVFPELMAISGDQGGRDVIRAHRADVAIAVSPHSEPPLDIDTEDAYRDLLARWPGV